jgi:anthranilate synthase component 2
MKEGNILLIDNFDSFTFTIADYLQVAHQNVRVLPRTRVDHNELEEADGIVLSPGPGNPGQMTDLLNLIKQMPASKPVLGICLGFQALGILSGASLTSGLPVHGKIATVIRQKSTSWLLENLPESFSVVRYHSLRFNHCPAGWDPVLSTEDGILMAMEKEDRPWAGVQFHPEAYLTEHGMTLIQNWLKKAGFLKV